MDALPLVYGGCAMETLIKIPYVDGVGPVYWRNEDTGVLARAIMQLVRPTREMTASEIDLCRSYLYHWIMAPAFRWKNTEQRDDLAKLAEACPTRRCLMQCIDFMVDHGMDPL